MEGDNAPAKKTRGKDIVKRKRIGWSDEERLAHRRWKERKVEDNRARVNSLVPGSPEFLSEEAKQKGREKAAEKKRKQRMRRRSESMESSYSPTQRLLTLPDGSVILNPMPAPLAMATGMYPDYQAIYTTPTSSVSSTSTPISTMTATPSSSTPRLVVEMQATPSASSSSSPGSAVATSSDSTTTATRSTTTATTATTTTTAKNKKNAKAMNAFVTKQLANVANRKLRVGILGQFLKKRVSSN